MGDEALARLTDPVRARMRALVDVAAPSWAGEAEIVRTYFAAHRTRERDLAFLRAQAWKETRLVRVLPAAQHAAAFASGLASDHPEGAPREKFAEEITHFRLLAGLIEELCGDAPTIASDFVCRITEVQNGVSRSWSQPKQMIRVIEKQGRRMLLAFCEGNQWKDVFAMGMEDDQVKVPGDLPQMSNPVQHGSSFLVKKMDLSTGRLDGFFEMRRYCIAVSCQNQRIRSIRIGRYPPAYHA